MRSLALAFACAVGAASLAPPQQRAGTLLVLNKDDARAHAVARRIPLGRSPEGILIAPDGARAFVAVAGDNHIAVVDLNAWAVIRRIETGHGPDGWRGSASDEGKPRG